MRLALLGAVVGATDPHESPYALVTVFRESGGIMRNEQVRLRELEGPHIDEAVWSIGFASVPKIADDGSASFVCYYKGGFVGKYGMAFVPESNWRYVEQLSNAHRAEFQARMCAKIHLLRMAALGNPKNPDSLQTAMDERWKDYGESYNKNLYKLKIHKNDYIRFTYIDKSKECVPFKLFGKTGDDAADLALNLGEYITDPPCLGELEDPAESTKTVDCVGIRGHKWGQYTVSAYTGDSRANQNICQDLLEYVHENEELMRIVFPEEQVREEPTRDSYYSRAKQLWSSMNRGMNGYYTHEKDQELHRIGL